MRDKINPLTSFWTSNYRQKFNLCLIKTCVVLFCVGLLFFGFGINKASAAAWYNTGWQYRQPVTITNANVDSLSSFQVEVDLSVSNFDFTKANSDGSDIRFTDSDGVTPLNYYLDAYNSITHIADFVVNAPSIPTSGTTIYLYYGNSGATSTSSWANTFEPNFHPVTNSMVYTSSNPGYNAWPTAEKLQNGNIIVAFNSDTTHLSYDGSIKLLTSTDNGATWATSTAVSSSPGIRFGLGGMIQLSNGTIILSLAETSVDNPNGAIYTTKSNDNGQTWSAPVQISNTFFTSWIYPYGKPIQLSGGTLLMPVYGQNTGQSTSRSALLQSTDGGSTWTLKGTVAYDGLNNFSETSVVALNSNNLLALVRDDTNNHTYRVTSSDGGSTWGSPTLSFTGVSPDVKMLSDGRILACVANRTSSLGVQCYLSTDNGLNWGFSKTIIDQTGKTSTDFGYPSSVQLANGNILTFYYYTDALGNIDIGEAGYQEGNIIKLFFDGLENGDLSSWVGVSGVTTSVSTTQKHSGAYSFYINDNDSSNLNIAYEPILNPDNGVISFWIYPQANVNWYSIGLNPIADKNASTFYLEVSPQNLLMWYDGSTDHQFSTSTSISPNTWTKITLQYNTVSNLTKVFVNGVNIGNMGLRQSGDSPAFLQFSSGSTNGKGDIFYVDDIYTSKYALSLPSASVLPDLTLPQFTSIAVNPNSSSATITWTTDKLSSSKVNYGLTSTLADSTTEANTSPRVQAHTVTLSNLVSCTTYHYSVYSADALANTVTSSDATFTTSGCSGNTSLIGQTNQGITTNGTTTLTTDAGKNFTVNLPTGFSSTTSNVVVQIKSLDSSSVINSLGSPSASLRGVGSVAFDVKALINSTTTLDSFSTPVTITYQYLDADISGFNESTLWMYHYHNGVWTALDNCQVNTSAKTITCTAPSFSVFSLFAQRVQALTPTPSPTQASYSSGGGGTVYGCKDSNATNYNYFSRSKPELCQYGTSSGTLSSNKKVFTRDLKLKDTGVDVKLLQQFLNTHGFPLANKGIGSKGKENTIFGPATKAALIKFQKANKIQPAVGYFGLKTQIAISKEL
jgi:BNR repeat-like domain/Domain of unknown function (DUF2341)/Putative peptidoglycan binding domain